MISKISVSYVKAAKAFLVFHSETFHLDHTQISSAAP